MADFVVSSVERQVALSYEFLIKGKNLVENLPAIWDIVPDLLWGRTPSLYTNWLNSTRLTFSSDASLFISSVNPLFENIM